jgi:hypothetical protein
MTGKPKMHLSVKIICALLFVCGCELIDTPQIPYRPPVVFVGYFNKVYDSLAGNAFWPNTCTMVGDTIRMYFYSTRFDEVNRIREGDLLRIDIHPNRTGTSIGTNRVLFHMARYHGTNASYTISPNDSAYGSKTVRMEVSSLDSGSGGAVDINKVYVSTGPISGTTAEALEIKDGRIFGRIE